MDIYILAIYTWINKKLYRMIKIVRTRLNVARKNIYVYCRSGNMNEEETQSDLLLNQIRCIFCGPSNVSKKNVIKNLLLDSNGLHFEYVYVFLKSLYQLKNNFFRKRSVSNRRYRILSIH